MVRGHWGPAEGGDFPGRPMWVDRLLATLGDGVAVLELVRDAEGAVIDMRYLHGGPASAPDGDGSVVGRLLTEVIPEMGQRWIAAHATVADSGTPVEFPHAIEELGRWFSITTYPAGPDRIVVTRRDVTDVHETMAVVQAREAHQRYLVALLDALRPLADPDAIQEVAARLLGEHVAADHVFYAEVRGTGDGESLHVARGFHAPGLTPIAGRFPITHAYGGIFGVVRAGRTLVTHGREDTSTATATERAILDRAGVQAYVAVPLVKQGRLVAILAVAQGTPRPWSQLEVELVEETALRTWAAVEQARAEAALHESEERYSSLFESMDEAFAEASLVRDASGRAVDAVLLNVNPAFERLVGRPREEILGRAVGSFTQPDLDILDLVAASVGGGGTHRFEARSEAASRWFDVTVIPGEDDRFAALLDDVTERWDAGQVLRDAAARQALLVELEDSLRPLDDAPAIHREGARLLAEHLDAGRCVSFAIDGEWAVARAQHARTLDAMPDRIAVAAIPGALRDTGRRGEPIVVTDTRGDERLRPNERRFLLAMGIGALLAVPRRIDRRWVGWLAIHVAGPRAWTAADLATVEEVAHRTWAAADRAETASALRASEAKHRVLFETITEGFVTAEVLRLPDGRVDVRFLEINPAFEQVTGADRTALLGRTAREAAPTTPEDWFAIAERVAFGRETVRLEFQLPDSRWLSTHVMPVGEPGSGQVAMLSSDVTDRRLAEEQREDRLRHERVAREEAEGASRLREEFLATVSHELRTPLAAILLWSRLLASGRAVGREREAIDTIERNAEVQRELIEDLLDASKMLAGAVRVDLRAQALAPVIAETIEAIRPIADERQIELRVTLDPRLHVAVDATRFRQVVRNLVDNAIRYSHAEATVLIDLHREGSTAVLVVSDTGRGIAASVLPHVFERFWRGERGGGGLGLGLAIASELVGLHGGEIEAASDGPGRGATFTVRLPLSARATEPGGGPGPGSRRPRAGEAPDSRA